MFHAGLCSNLASAIYFSEFSDMSGCPMDSLTQWLGQQGSEALDTDLLSSI